MNQQSYFRSSGYLSDAVISTESGKSLDITNLPPFLRTLLVTDGTVTKSLEAWFWEKVKIEPLNNKLEIVKEEIIGLEVETGDKVLQREVVLKGVSSNKVYATALSTVCLKYLPQDVGLALEKGEIGIGELLREKGVETYRDIFNINFYSKSCNQKLSIKSDCDEILTRSYRIRINNHPAIIVTEHFPVDMYK